MNTALEKHLFRDQLAVDLVKKLTGGAAPPRIVSEAFEIADLTVARIISDLEKLKSNEENQALENSLRKAEAMAVEMAAFEERRKTNGVKVTESDDLRELLAFFRSFHEHL